MNRLHLFLGETVIMVCAILLNGIAGRSNHLHLTQARAGSQENQKRAFGDFTGEILPVFYVRNLPASVVFYQKLRFRFDHYYDHHTGGSISEWKYDDSPLYAEMWSGEHRFALHQASAPDSLVVGGMRHYFGVRDVDAHYAKVKGNGIKASDIVDRPWMRMFTVTDPDGHVLYFQTRRE